MKSKKLSNLKIIAGIVALLLICAITFLTNAFIGNPISSHFAKKAIEKHVHENYSSLDLELSKVEYNFKDGTYFAKAKSKSNVDIHFYISSESGKVLRDGYESHVLDGYNTLMRLSQEYSVLVTNLLQKNLSYNITSATVMYEKNALVDSKDVLKLGMKFDKKLPLQAEMSVHLNLNDNSLKNIATVLNDVHREMKNKDCNISKYGLSSEGNGILVIVNQVTKNDIESGELEALLERAQKYPENSRILVHIKEEKK